MNGESRFSSILQRAGEGGSPVVRRKLKFPRELQAEGIFAFLVGCAGGFRRYMKGDMASLIFMQGLVFHNEWVALNIRQPR